MVRSTDQTNNVPKVWVASQLAIITLYLEIWNHALPDTYMITISIVTGIKITHQDVVDQREMLVPQIPGINQNARVR